MSGRNRAVSLSVDWDNIIKDETEELSNTIGSRMILQNIEYDRDTVEFCTGSNYTGKWNSLGMTHNGLYIFPYGVEYEGGMDDGMFHGCGTLTYPMGQKLEAIWDKGKMVSYKFMNLDGLEMDGQWSYCKMPDRRFTISIREGLQASPNEFRTNQQPTREIETGCYDTGDGFYNPVTKVVLRIRADSDYENVNEEVSNKYAAEDDFWVNHVTIVPDCRHHWIVSHCRKAWDEHAGYRPNFYEYWVSGREKELEEINRDFREQWDILNTLEVNETQVRAGSIGDETENKLQELDRSSTASSTIKKLFSSAVGGI